MKTTRKLRLVPLPKPETTKLPFACPTSLKADLDRYAKLHTHTNGEAIDGVRLIPHILVAFMARDKEFKKTASHKGNNM